MVDLTFEKICHEELRLWAADQKTLITMARRFQSEWDKEYPGAGIPDERGIYSPDVQYQIAETYAENGWKAAVPKIPPGKELWTGLEGSRYAYVYPRDKVIIIKGLEKLFAKIQQGQQIYRRTQERQARKRKQEKGPEQDGAESESDELSKIMRKVSKKMAEDFKEKPKRQSDRINKSTDPVSKSPLESTTFGSSPDQNQTNDSTAPTKDRAPKKSKTNSVIDFGPAVIYTGRKNPNTSADGSEKRKERHLDRTMQPKKAESAHKGNLASEIFRDSSSQNVDVAPSRSPKGLRTPILRQQDDLTCQIVEPPIFIGNPPRVVPRTDYNTTPWYGKIPVSLWPLNKATPVKQARITNYEKPSYNSGSEDNAGEVLKNPENPQAALLFNSDRLMTPNLPEDRKTRIQNPTSVPNFRRQESDEVMVVEPVTKTGASQEVKEIAPTKPTHMQEPRPGSIINIGTPSPEPPSARHRAINQSTGKTDLKFSDPEANATSKKSSVHFWILQSRQPRMVWELWPSANLGEENLASIFDAVRMYANDYTSDFLKVKLETVQQSFSFRIRRDNAEHFEDMKIFMLEVIKVENQNEGIHDVRPNIWISPLESGHM